MKTVDLERLRELFQYRDGKLFWKTTTCRRMKNGDAAGSVDTNGYLQTKLDGKLYLNHRVIWFMHHGHLPKYLDHINGNRLDNRIENLRSVTSSQNNQNSSLRFDNTSGVKGVSWHKKSHKWQAQIYVNGKIKHLGSFESIDNAAEFMMLAREMVHGDYANHGGGR